MHYPEKLEKKLRNLIDNMDDTIFNLLKKNQPPPKEPQKPARDERKIGRALTRAEIEELIGRLENLDATTAETYEYPVKHLVAHLHDHRYAEFHRVEPIEGKAKTYYLDFSSPPETWKMLCGRAGTYTIDADTLRATDFRCTLMN